MGMHQDIGNLRREYSRVDVSIPFEYRVILPDEKHRVQARITDNSTETKYGQRPNDSNFDPILEKWLEILNSKLDAIVSLLRLQKEGDFGSSFKAVNISGGGISFSVPEAIPLGEILEIKIMLTFQQPVVLVIYGEAVKSEFMNGGHLIAVHYIHMDDSIRDMIVRFVFEREREIIRETRR